MKRYSLLIQLVIYVFIMILALLGIVGGIYYQTSSVAIRQTTEQNTRKTIQQSGQFITSYLQKVKQTTSSLAENEKIKTYAQTPSQENAEQLRQLFATILKTDSDLVSAILVTKDGNLISTDPELTMKTSADMMKEKWYQDAIHKGAMPILTPARRTVSHTTGEKWVISIMQEVVDKDGKNLGVVRLDVGYKTLEAYLDQLQLGKEGFTFIVDANHDFVYHPKKEVYSSHAEMKAMAPYLSVKNGYVKSKQAYVSQYQIPNSGWTLIGVSSMEQLHAVQTQILWSFIGTGLFALGVCLIGIWFVLRLWIKPLRDLQATILKVGSGHSDLRANETGSPELVDLARQFNIMLDRIDQLMIAVKEEEQNVRKYELQALSSQINPHFLYNTLDTIVWMAEFNDSKRVVEVTKSLAKYFRLALNQGHEQISLKDEIDHVRQYLFIQKQRYGGKLQYEIDELSAYDNYQIPKLILQPLVENAIYHGIKEMNRQGMIRVSVSKNDTQLIVSIYDNGRGFVASETTNATLVRLGGVGLKNVNQRLQLQFGKSYHMEIKSEENTYTEIRLYFPRANKTN
ncbi:cache domain-containing sensor histidine kinase [Streptococcus anginosus]|uniref:Putative histidine kinase n=1 Tax=Streptococcus anginosus TaxID=1328 RepID=A0A3S4MTR4_STRAP|nr:sensor histidine kinase [Streptococcus anginosus]GAD39635.1 signal transduction mechanisms [Streptococcus intermedius SK54 = ATCC 27335]EGL45118.1 cache domain protein [Streptococcus anginosus SK52 = DSM 20563]MBZ2157100.1 sensor histidine kinase [Streptococcus anginosus]ORE83629.1 histidine kinase [Streptococcus anginosus SK52 = DSM 20563]UEB02506.1 sensor histidine kinase [Streptococcus anginosus subsp. anginosus]